MIHFLLISLIASIVLTIVLNGLFYMFPALGRGVNRLMGDAADSAPPPGRDRDDEVRVHVPWKTCLFLSVVLTIGLNLAI